LLLFLVALNQFTSLLIPSEFSHTDFSQLRPPCPLLSFTYWTTSIGSGFVRYRQESTTQKAHAFVGTRAEDRGWPRDDARQISRAAPEVLRSRGRQRKSDQLFGMGNTSAGPRWLAEARHESAFRPFDIGKPQLRPPRCDTRVTPEEKRRLLARRAQETEQRRALFNAETDAEET